jgi:hypothetical protein
LGNIWEHFENMLGTHWEQRKKNKKLPSPPPHFTSLSEGKNRAHHECMLSLPIGCMKFRFPKQSVTLFGKRLMAGAEFWGHSEVGNWNPTEPGILQGSLVGAGSRWPVLGEKKKKKTKKRRRRLA